MIITSFPYSRWVEQITASQSLSAPTTPSFFIECTPFVSGNCSASDSGYVTVKVTWLPDFSAIPGSFFYVNYHKVDEINYNKTELEETQDYIEIGGLQPNEDYEFVLVAVEDNFETPSEAQIFNTHLNGQSA